MKTVVRSRGSGSPAGDGDSVRPAPSLGDLVLFRNMSRALIGQLDKRCRWQTVAPDEILIPSGKIFDRVFFILSGELRSVSYTSTGRIVSLQQGRAGGLAEGSALSGPASLAYSVVAAKASLVGSVDAATLLASTERNSLLLRRLFGALNDARETCLQQLVELATLSVRDRIRSELMRLCQDVVRPDGSALIVALPTHADLASRISTQREAVSREMSHLQLVGLLQRRDGALFVPSVAKLATLSASREDR